MSIDVHKPLPDEVVTKVNSILPKIADNPSEALELYHELLAEISGFAMTGLGSQFTNALAGELKSSSDGFGDQA